MRYLINDFYVTINKHEMWVSLSAITVFSKTEVNNLILTFNEENMSDIYRQKYITMTLGCCVWFPGR